MRSNRTQSSFNPRQQNTSALRTASLRVACRPIRVTVAACWMFSLPCNGIVGVPVSVASPVSCRIVLQTSLQRAPGSSKHVAVWSHCNLPLYGTAVASSHSVPRLGPFENVRLCGRVFCRDAAVSLCCLGLFRREKARHNSSSKPAIVTFL